MAINPVKELTTYLEKRTNLLLDVVAEQPLRTITREKAEVLWLGMLFDPVAYCIQQRKMEGVFLDLLSSTDPSTLIPTCMFLKTCCLYQNDYGKLLEAKMIRMLGLLGEPDDGVKQAACTLLCTYAMNENIHVNILENTYSLLDLFRSRDPYSERAAATLTAYAFTNPLLTRPAVGVTSKTDILTRADNAYNKSYDLFARRMSLLVLKAAGRHRASMTNDDINEQRNTLRYAQFTLDMVPYFATTSAYAFMRHYAMWGVSGQLAPVVTSCILAGLASATIGGYFTKGRIEARMEDIRYRYGLAWDTEQRKDRLRRLNRSMSALPGKSAAALGDAIPERYTSLDEVTHEMWEERITSVGWGCAALGLLGARLPWYRVVPLVARDYTLLRMGPFFHKVFPAFSMKFSRRPRAVLPFIIAPTVALKAIDTFSPGALLPTPLLTYCF
eukprot:TRINITY_DN26685_c0_g1_i1.p2 TRINITY_DN26685_c0_g1~~TRINITY_DN26685_c0_g1_i1.p2  ORF type:complete len:457 (+),score=164.79 TRINITY_DN26685_c0_g1_i1:44-1372(+)